MELTYSVVLMCVEAVRTDTVTFMQLLRLGRKCGRHVVQTFTVQVTGTRSYSLQGISGGRQ